MKTNVNLGSDVQNTGGFKSVNDARHDVTGNGEKSIILAVRMQEGANFVFLKT